MSPIADGVGVNGGAWPTLRRLLFGVAGGGGIDFASFVVLVVFAICSIADTTCSSVDLRFLPRLAGTVATIVALPFASPFASGLIETRVERLKDMLIDCAAVADTS